MEFIDFAARRRGGDPGLVFPGWAPGETVAFFSPHDDDAVLGAGCLIQAVVAAGGIPLVLVFCRGDAGYSTIEAKATIVAVRREETRRAYASLGVAESDILSFGVPDFVLLETLVRRPVDPLGESLFDRLIAVLRSRRVSRIVFSSGHREHADHTAVSWHALYTAPQAGDPILADLGPPSPIRGFLAYAVWSDFEPSGDPARPAADKGLLADEAAEMRVRASLAEFVSQGEILRRTVAARRDDRKAEGGYLELYRTYDIRRPIEAAPYKAVLAGMKKG
jgi:LmbE family N-acetylglucosaminyl deacetylase